MFFGSSEVPPRFFCFQTIEPSEFQMSKNMKGELQLAYKLQYILSTRHRHRWLKLNYLRIHQQIHSHSVFQLRDLIYKIIHVTIIYWNLRLPFSSMMQRCTVVWNLRSDINDHFVNRKNKIFVARAVWELRKIRWNFWKFRCLITFKTTISSFDHKALFYIYL